MVGDDGLLYVSDSYTTRLFDRSGTFKCELHLPGKYNDWNSNTGFGRDREGNGYILTTYYDGAVHKVTPTGEVSLLLGGRGTLPGEFNNPKGIAVAPDGTLYIADTQNHRIQKFDKNGEFLLSYGSFGAASGQFNMPTQLALDKNGNLYVADTNNNRIQVFNSDGGFIKQISATANPALPHFYPADVTVDAHGKIYVADVSRYSILVFDTAGNLIRSFGSKGREDGQFITAHISVAVDADGFVYVAESFDPSRVQKFSPEGNFILAFGNTGTKAGLLDNATVAASDPIGNIFVANSTSGLVKKFNKNGDHLLTFGGRADSDGQFRGFLGDMKMDNQGYLYVLSADSKGSIQKFNSRGEFIARFAPTSASGASEPGAPGKPLHMAIDPEGFVYLSDGGFLYKYNPAGAFVGRIAFINNETGAPVNFSDNAMSGRIIFEIDNNGLLYVALLQGMKIFDLSGNYIRDFIPQDASYGIYALGIAFDAQNKMYTTVMGYMKKYDPATGQLLDISTYHYFLINLLKGTVTVNASGTHVFVAGVHKTLTCFTNDAADAGTASYISGTVYHDKDENCVKDSKENGLEGIIVETKPGPYYAITDKYGKYTIEVAPGTYTTAQILPQKTGSKIAEVCAPDEKLSVTALPGITPGPDFGNRVTLSPHLTVGVSSTRRRRCFESTTTVRYENSGFAPAPDARVYLQLPAEVALLSADRAYTRQPDGTYAFAVGNLAAGQRGTITIQDMVTCGDESVRGRTVCTRAWITPSNNAPSQPTPTITLTARCDATSGLIRFVIRNSGTADMAQYEMFRKFINGRLASKEQFSLAAGDSMVLWVPSMGATWRLEADQPEGNGDNKTASVTMESCTGVNADSTRSSGFVNLMPTDDEEAEASEECMLITDSYDPNDKLVTPVGRTSENYTSTGTALKYKIRFQNTGTDVAYRVVVVDTLSEHLDLSTLQVGAASHAHRLEVSGKGRPVLTWTFDNIMLPDSNANEPGSHGYILFSIKPKADLPEKTAVENFADIFFDFNSPVRTNVTLNRIYDMPLVVDEEVRVNLEDVLATPTIVAFAPAAGKTGEEITITGKRFASNAAGNKVFLNGKAATVVGATEQELRVLVPAGATTGSLQVITPDGGATATETFEVYQPPILSSFSPAEGMAGQTVILQGQHLQPELIKAIKLGNTDCEILSHTGSAITVRVPAGATTGAFLISTKGGEAVSAASYVVWYTPTISGLSKDTEIVGASISIIGENFATDKARNKVLFGQAAAQVLEATPQQLVVRVPEQAESDLITVETPGGRAATPFKVIPGPRFTAMQPALGSVGTVVEISGQHFGVMGLQDRITFNGQQALVLEVSSDRYKVRVPRGATTGKVQITGYGGVAYSTADFVVEELPPAEAIKVYPNPTSGRFTLSLQHADFDVQSVEIFDGIGRSIHTTTIEGPRPERLELQIRWAKPGLYTLHVKTERGLIIKRLTVL
ncbi:hypothetical protein GCM10007389_04930 [Pontibacter akesuensis]|nr:hypothetical protein GCM10007389_04930 [Pontibacter akesuensis]